MYAATRTGITQTHVDGQSARGWPYLKIWVQDVLGTPVFYGEGFSHRQGSRLSRRELQPFPCFNLTVEQV